MAAVAAITLYAWTTKTDFTLCGPILFIFGLVFGVAGIIIVSCGFKLGIVWSIIGVILFSFYLIWDTQMIMGGKRAYSYDEDSHVLAAICLYTDIINIFLYVLEIIKSD